MKHAKITTTIPQTDGTNLIDTKSYYENLSSYTQEIEQKVYSTDTTMLADYMKCLRIITDGTSKELTVRIKQTKGQVLITKTYTVRKENYGKMGKREQ